MTAREKAYQPCVIRTTLASVLAHANYARNVLKASPIFVWVPCLKPLSFASVPGGRRDSLAAGTENVDSLHYHSGPDLAYASSHCHLRLRDRDARLRAALGARPVPHAIVGDSRLAPRRVLVCACVPE